MATFTEQLRARGPHGLALLLELRRDLAAPVPASIRALAARASTRASLDRAVGQVDAGVLALLEAVLVLPRPVRPAGLQAALGADPSTWLAEAEHRALVWSDEDGLHAAPGLAELLGPWPAGLGPALAATLDRRSPEALADLAGRLGTEVAALTTHLADPAVIDELLARSPAGAAAVLDALTWGPPVGRSPARDAPGHPAVAWLLQHGLLAVGDPQHVLLPREVALARRGGRLHASPPLPPQPRTTPVDPGVAAPDAAQHAMEAVRLVGELVALWGRTPAPLLRAGGLGVRELRRAAAALDLDPEATAVIVEVAGAARLVADNGEEQPAFCATTLVDQWQAGSTGERWADLAQAWLTSDRAPWLVGTRDDSGTVRAALDPAHRRPWVARLRSAVLTVLAEVGDARPDVADVHAALAWRTPRSAPTEHAVRAVLAEATLLGVTGAGALAPHARALLGDDAPAARAARTLETALPTPIDEVLLGGDLTGIVPGRPSDALQSLLTEVAQVESRGAGLTVRFTEASVRSALDTRTAQEILAALGAHARGAVPQPLEYLITDAARRHGQVRGGAALSYLRGEPATLATLPGHPAMRVLGLRMPAPGVLIASATPAELVAAARAAGLPAVLEDDDGQAVRLETVARRVRLSPRPTPDPELARRRLEQVAADLAGTPDPDPQDPGTVEPVETLAVLQEAVAAGREVWLQVAGPDGPARRRVRPLQVDAGRVRVLDPERESELTLAVHRIVGAEPVDTASDEPIDTASPTGTGRG